MTDYTTAKYLSKYCLREVNAKCLFTSYSHYFFPLPKANSDQKSPKEQKNNDNKNLKENLKPLH